jgi:hypothetical protein
MNRTQVEVKLSLFGPNMLDSYFRELRPELGTEFPESNPGWDHTQTRLE